MFLSSGRLGTLSNIRVPGASSGGKTSRVNGPILPLGVEEVSRVALALDGGILRGLKSFGQILCTSF